MSTFSDNQSPPRFSPPQSAQPYRSLFGGPSSQDVDLEPYPEPQQDANEEDQDELDVIMGEPPLIEQDFSDDATYMESDGDGSASDGMDSDASSRYKARRKKEKSAAATLPPAEREPPSSPPLPDYRPNRFRGPESTWRKLTVEDRQNAQALEAIRARDLAAHLYNAYALRVRAREIARRATEDDRLQDEAEAFHPPKRWTAWPMHASEVPRVDEHLRREEDDVWTLRMQPDPRPSGELEESIMAIMLKSAKERFEAREWETRRAGSRSVSRSGRASRAQTEDYDASTGNEGDWRSDDESVDDAQLRPAVQADDEKSRRQLRPLTRNTITSLDQLLMGLHHARKGGLAVDDSSASEWQTDTESVVSGRSSSPRKRRTSRNTERSQSRGRKRTRRSSHSARPANERSRSMHASSGPPSSRQTSQHTSVSRHTSRSRGRSIGSDRRRSASRIRHGVRDWSEVLGIASMMGWPPAVVMRAAQRCSGLFGEDMTFQTMKEGHLQQVEKENGKAWEYAESESEEEEEEPPTPPPSRPSSKRSRSRAVSSKAGSVSRPSSPLSGTQDDTGPRPKGKGDHRKSDLVCPMKKCRRHRNGFSRTWNLNLHIQRMHPGYRPRSTDVKPAGVQDQMDDERINDTR
ncbi:hypothetical protein MW887_010641 [Aspergillus wentii]|nr:hypothetical protein MW887_010641 [Aspergillus wentii]